MALRRSWAGYVVWGSIAVCAVFGAAFTIALVVGAHRGIQIAGPRQQRPAPPAVERPQAKTVVPAATRHDIARIDDALRALAGERDRLAARVKQLEQALGDLTASIQVERKPSLSGSATAAPVDSPASDSGEADANPPSDRKADPEQVEVTASAARSEPTTQTRPAPQATEQRAPENPLEIFRPYAAVESPVPPPAPTVAPMQIQAAPRRAVSNAPRTEFAIDLGAEDTLERLRALWESLRGKHGAALNGLRPLVSIRDGERPGRTQLHLIAGPFVNAGTAARICAGLQAKGVTCQTTVFDGQRLAAR